MKIETIPREATELVSTLRFDAKTVRDFPFFMANNANFKSYFKKLCSVFHQAF